MILKPIITEKSLKMANEGKYTFEVNRKLNKFQIKHLIERTFKVHVTKVRVINKKGQVKLTMSRKKKIISPSKKAIVNLKEKEKIDLFEKAAK